MRCLICLIAFGLFGCGAEPRDSQLSVGQDDIGSTMSHVLKTFSCKAEDFTAIQSIFSLDADKRMRPSERLTSFTRKVNKLITKKCSKQHEAAFQSCSPNGNLSLSAMDPAAADHFFKTLLQVGDERTLDDGCKWTVSSHRVEDLEGPLAGMGVYLRAQSASGRITNSSLWCHLRHAAGVGHGQDDMWIDLQRLQTAVSCYSNSL